MKFAMELSATFGPSGNEEPVSALLRDELEPHGVEFKQSSLGSLIGIKPGKINGPGIILSAHMDEVGFLISKINKDGTLSFRTVGGIDSRLLPSKAVQIGENRLRGVIMSPPVHLKRGKDVLKVKDLRIFIGCEDKQSAAKLVSLGDYATFYTVPEKTANGWIRGKAWDDRIGCFIISEILKKDWDIDITGVFTVQEEVGLRGIQSALHMIKGDFAFAVEGTTSHSSPDEGLDNSPSTICGNGPAITAMDRMSIGNSGLKKLLEEVARMNSIPFQYKMTATGGTETYYLLRHRTGIPSICVSVPVRYIHAPVGMILIKDVENTLKLLEEGISLLQLKLKKLYGGK